ncbi:laterosporulin family class IId bacteriocin [Brevibacillus sp. SKDU10]|nr:laterosporulin family class IId bacteriocin [Brevibacillus sp. SKDU10]
MACVNQCPDAIDRFIVKDKGCHGVEKKYYKQVYVACMNGQHLYCRTEWGGPCQL